MTDQQQQGERLKTLLSLIHLSQTALAQRLGYTRGYISLLVSGEKPISQQILNTLIKLFPKVNTHWLMSGIGNPMLEPDIGETYQIESSEPRTLEDLEAMYRADPLAGLRDLVTRVESMEREMLEMKATVESLEGEITELKSAQKDHD